MGTYGDLTGPTGACGDLWGPMGPMVAFGGLWGPLGTCDILWGPVGNHPYYFFLPLLKFAAFALKKNTVCRKKKSAYFFLARNLFFSAEYIFLVRNKFFG